MVKKREGGSSGGGGGREGWGGCREYLEERLIVWSLRQGGMAGSEFGMCP